MLLIVVAVAALTYALWVAYLYSIQERIVFLPTKELGATPAARGLEYREVRLATADGERLHGWLVPAEPARATLLFLHGNAGNVSHRLESLRQFHELGLSVLIFDYRGYGNSTGSPSEAGTYRDAEAAWRYLVGERGLSPRDIVVFGRSLGGAVAVDLATRHTPAGLILESTFRSGAAMARHIAPLFPSGLLTRLHYPSEEKIQRVRCPVLVIHSRDDEIIPFEHGRALFAAAPEPKTFLELQGDHNSAFLVNETEYLQGLDGFLRTHVGP